MTITVKQDNKVYVLDEENKFVCAHIEAYVENSKDPSEAMYVCGDCDSYAPADVDGIDDEGHPEYRTPDTWEWQ